MKLRTQILVENNPNDEGLTLWEFKKANVANNVVVESPAIGRRILNRR